MNVTSSPFLTAARLRAAYVGDAGYALAYGSHAAGSPGSRSDLDLLFVDRLVDRGTPESLVTDVMALHHQHQLRLDTEVAYESKLVANVADIEAALAMEGFGPDSAGNVEVVPVAVTPSYLNSRSFKLRLILNALTTPHVFLGGDLRLYRAHCCAADRTVALLALALLDRQSLFTVVDAPSALVTDPSGASGEDFLGYQDLPNLHAVLHRGITSLLAEEVVATTDGARFEQSAKRRRSVIAQMRSPTRTAPPHGWDNTSDYTARG